MPPRYLKPSLRRALERKWRTSKGQDIPYSGLDPGHLLNILMWMRRVSQERAQEAASKEGAQLGYGGWKARQHPAWSGLLEEAKRRAPMVANAANVIDSVVAYNERTIWRVISKVRQDH